MTGVDTFEPTPTALSTAAQLTIEQHAARPGGMYVPGGPGTCEQCTPQGCPQLTWARRLNDPTHRGSA